MAMDSKKNDGSLSRLGFIDWATMGVADSLSASVREALLAIATTGECKAADEAWILFGEVTEVLSQNPLHVQVHRTSMLLNDEGLGTCGLILT